MLARLMNCMKIDDAVMIQSCTASREAKLRYMYSCIQDPPNVVVDLPKSIKLRDKNPNH